VRYCFGLVWFFKNCYPFIFRSIHCHSYTHTCLSCLGLKIK
jgi:hypothetical protein